MLIVDKYSQIIRKASQKREAFHIIRLLSRERLVKEGEHERIDNLLVN